MPVNTAQGIAAVAAAFVAAVVAAALCAFLSALLLPPLLAFRTEVLRTYRATDFFHLCQLTWRGEASKAALLSDGFLLSIQVGLLSSLLIPVAVALFLPGVVIHVIAVSLILGGLGGYCAVQLSTASHSPSSHRVCMDRVAFLTVYTCCWIVGAHLTFLNGWNQFVVYEHVCVCLVFGSMMHYVRFRSAHKWVVSLCVVGGYIIYNAVLQDTGRISPAVVVIMLVLNVCLGSLVSRNMVQGTNPFTAVVCLVFAGLVWFAFSQAMYYKVNVMLLLAPLKQMEALCVEVGQFSVVFFCTRAFLLERRYSNSCLLYIVSVGVPFNTVMIYKLFYAGQDVH